MLRIIKSAESVELYVKPWKWSFTLGPPSNKNRALVTFGRFDGGKGLSIAYYADAIAEFYPVSPDDVRAVLGPDRVSVPIPDDAAADRWASKIQDFFKTFTADDAAS